MSKYALFGEFLTQQDHDRIPLTFKEIEEVLGFKLPDSAYGQRAWWSNNADNNVMTRVWNAAGFKTASVDMKARRVVFRRTPKPPPLSVEDQARYKEGHKETIENVRRRLTPKHNTPETVDHHPLRGALKGTLRIVAGTDLTKPADPDWADRS